MADTIGAKLKVTGESQFSKAMREAAKNTKALDSELKLAEAQFKATGDAQRLMEEKGRILRDQLEQQNKAVATAREMLQRLASAGYDQNSSKVVEWRGKLAEAQAQVIQINQAIQDNAQQLQEIGGAAEDAGQGMMGMAQDAQTLQAALDKSSGKAGDLTGAVSDVGKSFAWAGVKETLDNINGVIDNTIRRAGQMAKALWDAGVDATVWADDLKTMSDQTGIDTETLQKWRYASRFIDTSVDTIVTAQSKITQGLGKDGKAAEDFAADMARAGVAIRDSGGEMRSTNDIFWDTITHLGGINNEAERDAQAMALLGKKAKELNPLIEAGRQAWEDMGNQAPLISKDKVDSLGDANDAIERMNAEMEALKLDVLASFAPNIKEIADAMTQAAGSVKAWVDSEEGREALNNVSGAISNIVKEITEGDFTQLVTDGMEGVKGLVEQFTVFVSNKDAVVDAFRGIVVAIGALKTAGALASIAQLAANIKIINGGIKTSALTSAAGSSATGAAAAAGGTFGSILSGVVLPVSVVAVAAGVISKFFDDRSTEHYQEFDNKVEEMATAAEQVATPIQGLADQLRALEDIYSWERGDEAWNDVNVGELVKMFPDAQMAAWYDRYGGNINAMIDSTEWNANNSSVLAEDLVNQIEKWMRENGYASLETTGQNAGTSLVNGVGSMTQAAYDSGYAVGSAAAQGMVDGAGSMIPSYGGSGYQVPTTGTSGGTINVRLEMDGAQVGEVVTPYVQDQMSGQSYSRRYSE